MCTHTYDQQTHVPSSIWENMKIKVKWEKYRSKVNINCFVTTTTKNTSKKERIYFSSSAPNIDTDSVVNKQYSWIYIYIYTLCNFRIEKTDTAHTAIWNNYNWRVADPRGSFATNWTRCRCMRSPFYRTHSPEVRFIQFTICQVHREKNIYNFPNEFDTIPECDDWIRAIRIWSMQQWPNPIPPDY